MTRRLAVFAIMLLLACTALAETPVSQPVYGPAPGDQLSPSMATNGVDFLAAWTDTRGGTPSAVYATRIAADGRVLDPTGIRVATGANLLGVFRMTSSYVVLTNTPSGVVLTRLNDQGIITEGPRLLVDHLISAAASNGTRLLLVDGPHATVLDAAGNILDADIALGTPAGSTVAAASNGATFLIATVTSSDGRLVLTALDADGHPRLPSTATGLPANTQPAIATDGSDYVVVFAGGPFDYIAVQANANAQVRAQATQVSATFSANPALAWTGSHYLMLGRTRDAQHRLGVTIVQRDGQLGDSQVRSEVTSDTFAPSAIVWNGSEALAAWSIEASDGDSLDLAAELLDADGSPLTAPRTIAQSANAQEAPLIATGAAADLVVWRETSGIYAGRVTRSGVPLDGRGVLVAAAPIGSRFLLGGIFPPPRAAFDGHSYVVVWSDTQTATALHVRFVDPATGAPGVETTIASCAGPFDVGRDDRGVVVFYIDCSGQLVAQRIDAAGVPGARSTITAPDVRVTSPRAAWNGSEWLVVWNEVHPGPIQPFVLTENVFGALLNHDFAASLLAIPIEGSGANEQPAAVTTNGSDFFVAWSHVDRGLYARRVAATGALGTLELLVDAVAVARDAIWDGTRYAVAYELDRGDRTHDLYLTHGSDGVAISSGWPDSREPSLAADGGMVRAAFVRVATEALYGGVPRVFVRDVVGRRRAAR